MDIGKTTIKYICILVIFVKKIKSIYECKASQKEYY
jgi:hypothetical protein